MNVSFGETHVEVAYRGGAAGSRDDARHRSDLGLTLRGSRAFKIPFRATAYRPAGDCHRMSAGLAKSRAPPRAVSPRTGVMDDIES